MRHFALVLVAAFLAHPLSAQEPRPAVEPVRVYLKVEELNSDAGGKAKVLAEPVMLATLGKPITFNCGKDVPLKIPLAEGLESIEYGWMLDRARLCPEVSALRCQETVRRLEVSIDRSSRDPASAVRSASGK